MSLPVLVRVRRIDLARSNLTMKSNLALTSAAVAMAFGLSSASPLFNEAADSGTLDELRARLVNLQAQAAGVQAAADDEQRQLTEAETARIQDIYAEFESVSARVDALERGRDRFASGLGRKTTPELTGVPAAAAAASAISARAGVILNATTFKSPTTVLFGQRSSEWKNSEEFLRSVANKVSDPRLLFNATGKEGSGVDGGYSVPPAFYGSVIDQALQQAEFAPRCRVFPSPSNNMTIPMRDVQDRSNSIAGIRANWAGEAQAQTAQRLKWRAVEVKLHKTFIFAEASNELAEDGLNYESQLTGTMAEATGYTLDDAILRGTGVGQPLGLISHASAIAIAAASGQLSDTIVYENLVAMYSRLTPACQKRATWFVSPNALPQLLTMKFPGSDNPVLLSGGFNDAATGAPAQTIFGRPVMFTEIARPLGDAGDIVLADMTQYALLMKSSARLQTDAGPGFASDIMSWRLIMRVGGQPMWDEPVTPYNGAPTLSWATYLAAR